MGRRKIEMKKIEPSCARKSTFNKRYKGITKKARELSVLCDVPVLLVTTTTSGGYNVFVGENRNFSNVVQQYVNESKENLVKTKKETFESLRKSFTDGHVVNVNGMHQIEGEEDSEKPLEETIQEIAELEDSLGTLRNLNQLEKVDSLEELLAMERSVRNLLARNNKIKAHIIKEQNACFQHFFPSYPRDPRCSTSTAVATSPAVPSVPVPSNHIGSLYGSNNPTGSRQQQGLAAGRDSNLTGSVPQYGPMLSRGSNLTGSMQLHGIAVSIGSNPNGSMQHGIAVDRSKNLTGSMQQHDLAVGRDRNESGSIKVHGLEVGGSSNPTRSVLQHDPTFGSSINPNGSMQVQGPVVDSNRNTTGSVLQHGPTLGCGSNPTESMQRHDAIDSSSNNPTVSMQLPSPAVNSNSNQTGSVMQHGPIISSDIKLTENLQQHGPTVGSDTALSDDPQNHSRNMPERADFQDSDSDLDALIGNLSVGDGPNQYMQFDTDSFLDLTFPDSKF